MRSLLLVTLIACSSSRTTSSPSVTPAAPAPAVVPVAEGRLLAVVSTSAWFGEVSGMGGEHYAFEGEVAGRRVVLHGGDHGVELGLFRQVWTGNAPRPRWYVAEIELASAGAGTHAPEGCRAGWCDPDMPRFDGEVLALVAAADEAAAEALLATLARSKPATLGTDATPALCAKTGKVSTGRCPRTVAEAKRAEWERLLGPR